MDRTYYTLELYPLLWKHTLLHFCCCCGRDQVWLPITMPLSVCLGLWVLIQISYDSHTHSDSVLGQACFQLTQHISDFYSKRSKWLGQWPGLLNGILLEELKNEGAQRNVPLIDTDGPFLAHKSSFWFSQSSNNAAEHITSCFTQTEFEGFRNDSLAVFLYCDGQTSM